MIDFVEEGKREGYIRPDLSPQVILLYTEMVRSLAYSRPELYARLLEDDKLYRDFSRLFLYGLIGRETHPELLRNIQADGPEIE